MTNFLRCTPTERALIREELLSGYSVVTFVLNTDGTYAAHVRDVAFEGACPGDLLKDLIGMLEES